MKVIPQEYSTNSPQCFKVLDISTIHISEEENGYLQNINSPLITYEYNEGFFVYVPISFIIDEPNIIKTGFSEGFINILKLAAAQDCKFVCFDADGIVYEDLPQYDW